LGYLLVYLNEHVEVYRGRAAVEIDFHLVDAVRRAAERPENVFRAEAVRIVHVELTAGSRRVQGEIGYARILRFEKVYFRQRSVFFLRLDQVAAGARDQEKDEGENAEQGNTLMARHHLPLASLKRTVSGMKSNGLKAGHRLR